jgi:hypothetical protein
MVTYQFCARQIGYDRRENFVLIIRKEHPQPAMQTTGHSMNSHWSTELSHEFDFRDVLESVSSRDLIGDDQKGFR